MHNDSPDVLSYKRIVGGGGIVVFQLTISTLWGASLKQFAKLFQRWHGRLAHNRVGSFPRQAQQEVSNFALRLWRHHLILSLHCLPIDALGTDLILEVCILELLAINERWHG